MNLRNVISGKYTPVIVHVKDKHYVPKGLTVRAWISDVLFTADCKSRDILEALRKDPSILSIEVSE
jgi:hypothetical protein